MMEWHMICRWWFILWRGTMKSTGFRAASKTLAVVRDHQKTLFKGHCSSEILSRKREATRIGISGGTLFSIYRLSPWYCDLKKEAFIALCCLYHHQLFTITLDHVRCWGGDPDWAGWGCSYGELTQTSRELSQEGSLIGHENILAWEGNGHVTEVISEHTGE